MEECSLMKIPYDVKEIIASHLNIIDVYNLSIVCKDDNALYGMQRCRSLDFSSDFRFELSIARNIFKKLADLSTITHVNFNGIYWIDGFELRSLLQRLKNLQCALLLDTKVSYSDQDIKVFKTLKQLKIIGISLGKKVMLDVDVDPVKEALTKLDHRRNIILDFQNNKILEIFFITNTPSRRGTHYIITKSNWLNEAIYKIDLPLLQNQITTNIRETTLTYKDLIKPSSDKYISNTEEVFKRLVNIEKLLIRNPEGELPPLKTPISLDAFKYLKMLKVLHIEVTNKVNSMFLKTLFQNCSELTTLKIRSDSQQFYLTYLEYATRLEELSFECSAQFQAEKFFLELVNCKSRLKRLSLKFEKCAIFTSKVIKSFFDSNPQIIFFLLQSGLPHTAIKIMQREVDNYKTSKKQIFKFCKNYNSSYIIDDIPQIHLDMIDAKYVL